MHCDGNDVGVWLLDEREQEKDDHDVSVVRRFIVFLIAVSAEQSSSFLLVGSCCLVLLSILENPDLWYVLFGWLAFFFFSSRRRHTRLVSDWSSDVCSSD